MSDCEDQKHLPYHGKTRESMDLYKSLWMGHWMQTSCGSASQVHNCGDVHSESKDKGVYKKERATIQIEAPEKAKTFNIHEDPEEISQFQKIWRYGQQGMQLESNVESAKGVSAETRTVHVTSRLKRENLGNLVSPVAKAAILNSFPISRLSETPIDQENCTSSSCPYSGNAKSEQWPFPNFDFSKKQEKILPQKTGLAIVDGHPFSHQIAGKSGYSAINVGLIKSCLQQNELTLPPTETDYEAEGIARNLQQQKSPPSSPKKKILPVGIPFHEDITGSTSNSVVRVFKSKGSNAGSCVNQKQEQFQAFPGLACKEPVTNTYFTLTGGKKDVLQQIDDNIFKSASHFPVPGEQRRGIESSVDELVRCPSDRRAINTKKDLKCRHPSLHRMPLRSLHDEETMQICTTMDAVEGVVAGPPKHSQRTHHLLITKKTNVNLSEGESMIRESTFYAEFKESSFPKMIALPPVFDSQDKKKAKFQHLRYAASNEENKRGNNNPTCFPHTQNESSMETNAMFLDVNQTRTLSGVVSSASHEVVMAGRSADKSLAAQDSMSKEVRSRNVATEPPNMDEELAAGLCVANSTGGGELSTSKTESLDIEHLLTRGEQPQKSYSSAQQGNSLDPEPSSRWVKRLRLSASDPVAPGTKTLKIGDASPKAKVNELFSRVMNFHKISSAPTLDKQPGKEPEQLDRKVMLLINKESSLMGMMKQPKDLFATNSWIQRWRCPQEATKLGAPSPPVVLCEPEKPNTTLEEFQRKQFPSIAAMALMGKAVSNFRPSEFRKRGSLVVWNTHGF